MINEIKLPVYKINQTKTENPDKDDKKIRQTCQEFESVFISYLLKNMRKTIPNSNAEGEEFSRDVYTSMMDEEVAKSVAKGSGIGLADTLYYQLTLKKS
jgi:peptidoglycan hydrolase FlgJ